MRTSSTDQGPFLDYQGCGVRVGGAGIAEQLWEYSGPGLCRRAPLFNHSFSFLEIPSLGFTSGAAEDPWILWHFNQTSMSVCAFFWKRVHGFQWVRLKRLWCKKNCWSRSALPNTIVTSHMWLFKFKFNFQCFSYTRYISSMLDSHYLLDSPDTEHSHHCRKFCRASLYWQHYSRFSAQIGLFGSCSAFMKWVAII